MTGPACRVRSAAAAVVALAAAAWVVCAATPAAARQEKAEEFEAVLDRAADYVAAYQRDFIGVVAEETYRQEVKGRRGVDARGFATETRGERRTLKADMLLVRAPAGDRWLQFRDVFEVDGRPVRDRAERLAKLFLQPSPTAQQQVEDITAASARYNIGGVARNINLPVLALAVLDPSNRPWFSFTGGSRKDGWEIAFREERTGTLIRTNGDRALPIHGRFTVDGATGRVLSSELRADSGTLRAEIDVFYQLEPSLGILVPREMRENYATDDGGSVEGRATYANYRRYQVTVDQKIK